MSVIDDRPTQDFPRPDTEEGARGAARADALSRVSLRDRLRPRLRRFRPLPPRTRMIFWLVGAPLALLGVLGLFLPFLQGFLFLLAAAAILSLASERVDRALHGLIARRWPRAWHQLQRLQTRLRWRFRERKRVRVRS